MATNDEAPGVDRPTKVDAPPAAVRPSVPDPEGVTPGERTIPVDIIPPIPAQRTAPHQPKHAAPTGTPPPPRRSGRRFGLGAVLILGILAVVGSLGQWVLPDASAQARPSSSPVAPGTTADGPTVTDAPATGAPPESFPAPSNSGSSSYSPPPGTRQRPADIYGGWAGARSVKLGIPVVALQAYGYAEAVTARATPKCHLTWTTLAGIGKVESDHGQANSSVLQDDGRSVPPIIGPPLDGQNNRQSVPDTDQGTLDNDKTWDRAVGPMQFLPATWKQWGLDADADGVVDINDIDDAALTAAAYLCADGHDLSTGDGWNAAIHAYNLPEEYRAAVFNATNDYGRRDHQN